VTWKWQTTNSQLIIKQKWVLSKISPSIKLPLSIICTKSYEEGRLPSDWKNAYITPIHKKGLKANPENDHLVIPTSVIGKMMESIIRDSPVNHMMDHNLFYDQQHGFIPGCSCMIQLLVTGIIVWVAGQWCPHWRNLFGFQKSFDTVPHQRLLRKLKAHGKTGKLLEWIWDFLTGWRQRVIVNGKLSSLSDILSGLP